MIRPPRGAVRFGLVAEIVVLFLVFAIAHATSNGGPEPCGAGLHTEGAQDPALVRFARDIGVAYPEAFKNIANVIDRTGRLPDCYLTKGQARQRGWQPGANLWLFAPGAAIGGDSFGNRERRLPAPYNGRYVEADLDYTGGNRRGAHRIVFVGDSPGPWLIWVTVDHYRFFKRFTPQ